MRLLRSLVIRSVVLVLLLAGCDGEEGPAGDGSVAECEPGERLVENWDYWEGYCGTLVRRCDDTGRWQEDRSDLIRCELPDLGTR